jgi:hypothetical protein
MCNKTKSDKKIIHYSHKCPCARNLIKATIPSSPNAVLCEIRVGLYLLLLRRSFLGSF